MRVNFTDTIVLLLGVASIINSVRLCVSPETIFAFLLSRTLRTELRQTSDQDKWIRVEEVWKFCSLRLSCDQNQYCNLFYVAPKIHFFTFVYNRFQFLP